MCNLAIRKMMIEKAIQEGRLRHFQWADKSRTQKEWVLIAEELEKQHGHVPGSEWLKKNKMSGLVSVIGVHPELFSHLKRAFKRNRKRTIEEWVSIAEKLTRENGGKLPHSEWLKKNKYGGLIYTLKKQPELFSHLKQENKSRTLEEWVSVAERLARENGGLLPRSEWLRKNKYWGLVHALRECPELFSHLKQENKSKTPKEWVLVAEKLARENGGLLPRSKWLQKNKYWGLIHSLKRYPELFIHIKRR